MSYFVFFIWHMDAVLESVMPRWSSPLHFTEDNMETTPQGGGTYEIGFYRSNHFNPKYIGKSDKLRDRLNDHLDDFAMEIRKLKNTSKHICAIICTSGTSVTRVSSRGI